MINCNKSRLFIKCSQICFQKYIGLCNLCKMKTINLMKTINFIISGTINLYIIYLAFVGIISKRELNSLVGIVR